jgi:hypothetical protein
MRMRESGKGDLLEAAASYSVDLLWGPPVQRGVSNAAHGGAGVWGWAPPGVTQYPTGTRTQNSRLAARVDRVFVFG